MDSSRCEECGYSLAGFSPETGPPRCPECAAAFDADRPWAPAAMPTMRTILWRLCGPVATALAAFVLLALSRFGRNWGIWPFFLVWFFALVGIGFLWPFGWIHEAVEERVPRRERNAIRWRLLLFILGINSLIMIAALILFFAML